MTREEAINHLGTYRFRGINHTTAEFIPAPDVWQEALEMAIAALREQETVTDSHQFETVTNRNGLTNADHIRSMTDEELKLYLCYISDCAVCLWQSSSGCKLEDWLKQPYKGGGDCNG